MFFFFNLTKVDIHLLFLNAQMGIQGSHLHFLNAWTKTKGFDSHLQNPKPSRTRPLVLSYKF